jgi:hypothetical protein
LQRAGSVNVDVGFGRADLLLPDQTRVEGSGFPKRVDWKGTGPAFLEIDIGTGDATIRLQ